MINSSCLSAIKLLDYDQCPGRYCGRVLLDENNCTFSECQVNIYLKITLFL